MQFSFDTKDLEDSRNYRILEKILQEFSTGAVDYEETNLSKAIDQAFYDQAKVWGFETSQEAVKAHTDKQKAEAAKTPETNSTSEIKSTRGRPKKSTSEQAAELHKALQAAPGSAAESASQPASEEIDLLSLAAKSVAKAAPAEPDEHMQLVEQIRALMFDKGHVWMRNVLEDHKKHGKTLTEMPDDILRAILANPAKYDGVK